MRMRDLRAYRWVILTAFVFVAMFAVVFHADQTAEAQCLESGRGWAVAGHHQQTSTMLVDNTMIPQTSTVTDYGCFEVKR